MEATKPKREKLTIGLLLISTGQYDQFLQPLIESVNRHFFPGDDVVIYLFGDKPVYNFKLPARISIIVTQIKHEPWPASTLFRYKHFDNASKKIGICDYVFYSDADMMIVGDVTDEILFKDGDKADIIVTRHPGFWNNSDWGSHNCSEWSKAYLRPDERHRYVAGGFQGGKTDRFLEMVEVLAHNIDDDYNRGVIAEHNDENHINWFVNKHVYQFLSHWVVKDLSPAYCMIPEQEARVQFGLTDINPIIYALTKNHEELRKH